MGPSQKQVKQNAAPWYDVFLTKQPESKVEGKGIEKETVMAAEWSLVAQERPECAPERPKKVCFIQERD